jgi:hypothetical protein
MVLPRHINLFGQNITSAKVYPSFRAKVTICSAKEFQYFRATYRLPRNIDIPWQNKKTKKEKISGLSNVVLTSHVPPWVVYVRLCASRRRTRNQNC